MSGIQRTYTAYAETRMLCILRTRLLMPWCWFSAVEQFMLERLGHRGGKTKMGVGGWKGLHYVGGVVRRGTEVGGWGEMIGWECPRPPPLSGLARAAGCRQAMELSRDTNLAAEATLGWSENQWTRRGLRLTTQAQARLRRAESVICARGGWVGWDY
jgi:hypothetical protein